MCGIAGRWNYASARPVDPALVAGMCSLIAHRGPDGQGVVCDGAIGLGHRRLAIIDLSENGRQPMSTADGRLTITFNGEIYNFAELRAELERHGRRCRTRTDTEVILHAYDAFGVRCLDRLRGMFAFAIWDARERVLFVARDRLGKKPLFYRVDQDGLEFASEPKAFLANAGFHGEADPLAISYYLTYQYVPAPLSAFKGVQKLRPAHYLLVRDGRVEETRYWRLSYGTKRRMTEEDARQELLGRLEEATRLRLVSDVPLGAFLSGGVDSGTIVALMARHASGPVKTFSIGFDEQEYNELPFARLVADRYSTEHHEFIVRPDAAAILPQLVWHYNEPYADSSAVPTYYLSRLTRQHVTVALNGDAGDENFAGYDRYVANILARRLDWLLPSGVRQPLASLARHVCRGARSRTVRSRLGRLLEGFSEPAGRRYGRWVTHFHSGLKDEIVTPEFAAETGHHDVLDLLEDAFAASDARDAIDATLDVDVNTYLPHDLLVKVDIATMAHGLEGRSPLLDHELMEFVASLPSDLKLRGLSKKYLLKEMARTLMPDAIIDRPKMGFGVPIDRWFRVELREMAYDVLLDRRLAERGQFRVDVVKRLLDEHSSGAGTWHYHIWNLLMLELWYRMFIDERPVAAPAAEHAPVPVMSSV